MALLLTVLSPAKLILKKKNALSGFMDVVIHVGASLLLENACLFPDAQTLNSYTETILIKSLVGLLALVSY